MVKIDISIEGENLSEITSELTKILAQVVKTNKPLVREILKVFGEEALSVLMERKMLEKGAKLYRELIEEINWQYKEEKS
ncbi:MAG TPA: hypothetical protein ENI42_05800 [Thermoplasmatales archaeon]|nr:hypothetical protein [Thermoplasmatales archaeon]